MLLFVIVILQLTFYMATPQECTHQFTIQPPVKLNCRPLETVIRLQCAASSTEDMVAWLWTRSKEQAGSNGTLIVSNSLQNVYKIVQHVHHLKIRVTESTLGYYWCEIRNAGSTSLRPTTITPVCPPQDDCLPQCTTQAVSRLHSNVPTCAKAADNYTRPSLPDCNIPFPSRSCTTTISHNIFATTTTSLITSSIASPSLTPDLEDPSTPSPLPFSIWIIVGLIVAMGAVFLCVAVIVTLCCYCRTNARSDTSNKRTAPLFQHVFTAPLLLQEDQREKQSPWKFTV